MLSALALVAALTVLCSLIAAGLYSVLRRWKKALGAAVLVILSMVCFVQLNEADARSKGFATAQDMTAANRAGVTDPAVWRVEAQERIRSDNLAEQAERAQQETENAERAKQNAIADRETAQRLRIAAAVIAAEEGVRNRLKDPSSADIRTISEREDSFGHVVVCGGVNAKNSYGGFTGIKGFVATPETNTIEFESDDPNSTFFAAWTNHCRS